jgi:hypothetical protein
MAISAVVTELCALGTVGYVRQAARDARSKAKSTPTA